MHLRDDSAATGRGIADADRRDAQAKQKGKQGGADRDAKMVEVREGEECGKGNYAGTWWVAATSVLATRVPRAGAGVVAAARSAAPVYGSSRSRFRPGAATADKERGVAITTNPAPMPTT